MTTYHAERSNGSFIAARTSLRICAGGTSRRPNRLCNSLGPGSRFQNSSCPSCLLVAQIFYGSHKTLAEIEDVEISWQETVPDRRAFQVLGSKNDTYIAFAMESAPGDASRRPSASRGTILSYYVEETTKSIIEYSSHIKLDFFV